MRNHIIASVLTALLGVIFTTELSAQTTSFTYQGRLTDNGVPYSGSAEFLFTLWDAASGGTAVATNVPAQVVVPVSNGLFTVELDFGDNVFDGSVRFLQIEVRTTIGPFTTLTPRQPITPAPQAIHAATAAQALTVDMGTISNPSFIGTTDDQPLELFVDNQRALRIEDNGDGASDDDSVPDGAPNMIGGSRTNFVAPGVVGATIAGGGAVARDGLPAGNRLSSDFAAIGGGAANIINDNAFFATISGGYNNIVRDGSVATTIAGGGINTIAGNSPYCAITGGERNQIESDSEHAAIHGGYLNRIATGSGRAVIAGGSSNSIGPNSDASAISGGSQNSIASDAIHSTIAGGIANGIGVDAEYAVVGGGNINNIADGADYAMIPGGAGNDVGPGATYAFAAGHHASANHRGAFVWADSAGGSFPAPEFPSIQDDEFAIRAANGVRIANSGNGAKLLRFDTERAWEFRQFSSGAGAALELGTVATTNPKNFIIRANNVGINTTAPTHLLHVNGVARSTQSTWATSSDRRAKHNITTLEGSLDRIARLRPVSFEYTPEYKAGRESYEGRFTGFIAQEVEPVFPDMVETVHEQIGDREVDDFRVLNAGGLTPHLVAAIKELHAGGQQSKAGIEQLRAENTELRHELQELKHLIETLTMKGTMQ